MAKFRVSREADYVVGHLRSGHEEGVIEAESKEEALSKLMNGEFENDLEFVLDDYELEDSEFGNNEYEIEEVEE